MYGIDTDHLDTPRVIKDGIGNIVWRWDSNADPFGANMADEDPDHDGRKFTYNLRFPGQVYDQESGLNYNYQRSYDAAVGSYTQSDPIGLNGGINTYAYVEGNPLTKIDPFGLDAEMCTRDIQFRVIPGQHCFMRFNGDDNDTSSFDPKGTHPDPAPKGASCEATKGSQDDNCIKREMKKCENYDFIRNNCCHCAEQAMKACGQTIPAKHWPNWQINPGPQSGEPGYRP